MMRRQHWMHSALQRLTAALQRLNVADRVLSFRSRGLGASVGAQWRWLLLQGECLGGGGVGVLRGWWRDAG